MRRVIVIRNTFDTNEPGWTPEMENQYKEYRRGGRAGPPGQPGLWAKEFEKRVMRELSGKLGKPLKLGSSIRGSKDIVGSPEEVAYGEGFHASKSTANPYADAAQKAAWERGRVAAKNQHKFKSNYYKGELRNKRFEAPAPRDDNQDFKSERGWVGKVVAPNGNQLAQSEPFISERSAQRWLSDKIAEYARKGMSVKGRFVQVFFDPNLSYV